MTQNLNRDQLAGVSHDDIISVIREYLISISYHNISNNIMSANHITEIKQQQCYAGKGWLISIFYSILYLILYPLYFAPILACAHGTYRQTVALYEFWQ